MESGSHSKFSMKYGQKKSYFVSSLLLPTPRKSNFIKEQNVQWGLFLKQVIGSVLSLYYSNSKLERFESYIRYLKGPLQGQQEV